MYVLGCPCHSDKRGNQLLRNFLNIQALSFLLLEGSRVNNWVNKECRSVSDPLELELKAVASFATWTLSFLRRALRALNCWPLSRPLWNGILPSSVEDKFFYSVRYLFMFLVSII